MGNGKIKLGDNKERMQRRYAGRGRNRRLCPGSPGGIGMTVAGYVSLERLPRVDRMEEDVVAKGTPATLCLEVAIVTPQNHGSLPLFLSLCLSSSLVLPLLPLVCLVVFSLDPLFGVV